MSGTNPKTAIVSVINDLVTDQRVARTCALLTELGFNVLLVGRNRKHSAPLPQKAWKMHRMGLLFSKGPFFYAEFNIRLLLFLIFRKAGLLVPNDLDTLLPNFIIHKIKRIPLVYDSHEFFTETPEVIHRPWVRAVWLNIEKRILPRLKTMITVNDSLAGIFSRKYGIQVIPVRNVPMLYEKVTAFSYNEMGIPEGTKIILLQGSGINIQRGAEELVESMEYLTNTMLLIIGSGDVLELLKQLARKPCIDGKVRFLPRMPVEELRKYTASADLGLSLDKDTCPNYHFSLPNKIFDYIHAGTPVLASPLPEVKRILHDYGVGRCIRSHEPKSLAADIQDLLDQPEILREYRQNCLKVRTSLCWENEKQLLIPLYAKYL